MKRTSRIRRMVGLAVAASTAFSAATHAATSFTITDDNGAPDRVSVVPGGKFEVAVKLNTSERFAGFSIYLEQAGFSGGAANFSITKRTRSADNPLGDADATAPDSAFLSAPVNAKSTDLGYVSGTSSFVSGLYELMTLEIAVAPTAAVGTYSIQLDPGSVLVGEDFGEIALDNLPAAYTVDVVTPEPAALSFAGLAVACATRRRRR